MRTETLKIVECKYMPDLLENGFIYYSKEFKLAIHLCGCGCGGKTVTPIDDGTRGWVLTNSESGITLRPSIGNQKWPCKSHYFITDGKIDWLES